MLSSLLRAAASAEPQAAARSSDESMGTSLFLVYHAGVLCAGVVGARGR